MSDFSRRVKAACEVVPAAGRFHDKVYLHAAWAIGRFGHEMGLDAFKAMCFQAHKAGEIELSRADMVEAMKPYDVKRSNYTSEMGATFNFIRM